MYLNFKINFIYKWYILYECQLLQSECVDTNAAVPPPPLTILACLRAIHVCTLQVLLSIFHWQQPRSFHLLSLSFPSEAQSLRELFLPLLGE